MSMHHATVVIDSADWLLAIPVRATDGSDVDFSATPLSIAFRPINGGSVVCEATTEDGMLEFVAATTMPAVDAYCRVDLRVAARTWTVSAPTAVYGDLKRHPDPLNPLREEWLGRVALTVHPGSDSAGIAAVASTPILLPIQPYDGRIVAAPMLVGPQGAPGGAAGPAGGRRHGRLHARPRRRHRDGHVPDPLPDRLLPCGSGAGRGRVRLQRRRECVAGQRADKDTGRDRRTRHEHGAGRALALKRRLRCPLARDRKLAPHDPRRCPPGAPQYPAVGRAPLRRRVPRRLVGGPGLILTTSETLHGSVELRPRLRARPET